MSRIVTAAVEDAIVNNNVQRQTARLTVYKSRIYFEAGDLLDNAPDVAHPLKETGFFMPEAISFSGTKFLTVMVDYNGRLLLMRSDSDTLLQPTISAVNVQADPRSRPGIFGNVIFYQENGGGAWRKMVVDEDLVIAGTAECVISDDVYSDFATLGAVYPVSVDDAFFCTIDDGGIALDLSIGGDPAIRCQGRLIRPDTVYTNVPADIRLTHFAGAAQTDLGYFFYISHYDGSVKGVKFSNGMFSDFFTAIPQDLSIVKIGNVFSHNNIIHMCYRFERSEEFSSVAKYTNLSQSTDGMTFNMDMRVLVTMVDYRFMAAFDGDSQVIFSASNRSYQTDAHYQIVRENAPNTVTKVVTVSGSISGFSVELKAGSEEYYDDLYIIDGAYSKLEIGVQSTDGDVAIKQADGQNIYYKFITYHDVCIAEIDKGWGDGARDMALQVVPDGPWHTSVMTHPMYMEIQGKQGIYDPAQKMENLYKLSGTSGVQWSLSVDLWPSDGSAATAETHAGGVTSDHWSPDLETLLDEYPVFGNAANYTFRIFGWSRAGVPDTNPNTADATPTSTDNDDFYGLVEVENTNGVVSTVVTTLAELASAHSNPIQTYFTDGVRDGSEPVVYSMTNPGEGYKIKRVGVRVISDTGNTTYLIERVELPGIKAIYKQESIAEDQNWNVVDVSSNWAMVDQFALEIGTDNATNGNETEMTYSPKAGHCYAIAVVGDVSFTRGGIDYLQDAHFVAQISSSETPYAPLDWERSYPPGTAPTANSCVKVKFSEWPYYPVAILTKDDVVVGAAPGNDHAYLLHWADSRMEDSQVNAGYIPYFYSDGTKLKVQFHLAGSGTISNIVDAIQVYIFESPETIDEFGFYGGDTDPGTSQPFQIVNTAGGWADPYFTPGVDYYQLTAQNDIVIGNSGVLEEVTLRVRNNTATPAYYTVRMKFSMRGNAPPGTIGISQQWVGAASESNGIPHNGSGNFEYVKTVHIGAMQTMDMVQFANVQAAWMAAEHREWYVTVAGEPSSNQVPASDPFTVTIPVLNTVLGSEEIGAHIATNRKGVPQIIFSTRPYSAWNFEITGRFHLVGEWSQGGLIGLASDEDNFILGYIRDGLAGIAVVRSGARTTLFESVVDEVEQGKMMDLRFWHRDGRFGLEVKRAQDFWPPRESQFVYDWDGDTDGPLCSQNDIFHVGAYALIDPPKFRSTGFRSDSRVLGVMPLDLNPNTSASGISAMPESGAIEIGARIYNFTGKVTTATTPRGPFHLRNRGVWAAKYNSDREGYSYPQSDSIEMLFFRWWTGADHALDYDDAYLASSEGYGWLIDKVLWKVWITTGGAVVWLRNRARFYSDSMPSYYNEGSEKIWITNVLTGVTPVATGDETYRHPVGAFAYLHSDDSVSLHGFTGFSGERDYSIMNLLDHFCRVSGTQADPYGDFVLASQELDDTEEVELG